MVLISDGIATAASKGVTNPDQEAFNIAKELNQEGISALLIDTLSTQSKRGNMNQLAKILGCRCHHIHNLRAGQVLQLIAETETEE